MPVVNTKSKIVTELDAFKRVNSDIFNGRIFSQVATVEVAAGDDDTSVYRFFRVPSNAVILRLELFNDAITAGTVYNFGVHQTAANGGAVVDVDAFASSVDLSSARVVPLDLRFEASGVQTIEQKLWQIVTASPALTVDPNVDYDITATGATVGTAAGTISLRIEYQM